MKITLSKLVLGIAIVIMAFPLDLSAQARIEISPYGGYMLGGKMRFYEGDLKINDAANYGLALDVEVAPDTKIEIFWSQMGTTAQFNGSYGYDFLDTDPFDVNLGYIQIGSLREIDMDNIRPFGAFTLGTAYFIPQSNNTSEVQYENTWKFSVTLGGGVKIWFTDRVGIRLQGRLMLPMFWGGAGFSVGTGGSGFTVGAGTSMAQGDFTGGLIIALGD